MPRRVQVYCDGEASPCAQGEFSPTGQSACTSCAINEVSEFTGINQVHKHEPAPHTIAKCRLPRDGGVLLLLCAQTPNCVVGVV